MNAFWLLRARYFETVFVRNKSSKGSLLSIAGKLCTNKIAQNFDLLHHYLFFPLSFYKLQHFLGHFCGFYAQEIDTCRQFTAIHALLFLSRLQVPGADEPAVGL